LCPSSLFAEVKGAVRYAVQVDGLNGSGDVVGGEPPFPHGRCSLTGAPGKTVTLVVPGGSHWFPLGWYSTGQGCGEAESVSQKRWVITSATVTIDPDFVGPPTPKPPAPKELRKRKPRPHS
jgi:hypothetical protein